MATTGECRYTDCTLSNYSKLMYYFLEAINESFKSRNMSGKMITCAFVGFRTAKWL